MNSFTTYFLIIGTLSSLTCVIFSSFILRSFFRKRTMGSLLLSITFLSTTIAEILLCSSFYIETFIKGSNIVKITEFLTFTCYLFFAFNIVFLYVFGNRLLLHDNDIVRLLFVLGFTFLTAFSAGLVYKNIFSLGNPDLYTKILLVAPQLSMIFPERSFIILAILTPLGVTPAIRIIIEAIKIQRGTKDPIAKKGFQFIWQGTLFWYLGYSATFGMLWFVEFISTNPILVTGIFTFKFIFSNIIGFALLYLGWVMPDRFKRRFRKKAWIVQVQNGDIVADQEASAGVYIHKNNPQKPQFVEITNE